MILMLGSMVNGLLILASGDVRARPGLTLLVQGLGQGGLAGSLLEVWNPFYIWSNVVLAIGLSRLAEVSFKEAAFWVFGYWLVLRVALILLA